LLTTEAIRAPEKSGDLVMESSLVTVADYRLRQSLQPAQPPKIVLQMGTQGLRYSR